MAPRTKSDPKIRDRRVANDIKVLQYLMDNLRSITPGSLESPQKLATFYAGYTAMRSLWDVKTHKGKRSTGDAALDGEMSRDPGKLIFRIDQEVSHSIGAHTKTLLRVSTFKYWGKKLLHLWGQ